MDFTEEQIDQITSNAARLAGGTYDRERGFVADKLPSISSEDLTQTPEFKVPQNQPIATQTSGMLGQFQAQSDNYIQDLTDRRNRTETSKDRSLEQLLSSLVDTQGETQLTADQYSRRGGVDDTEKELNDINQQLREEQHALRRQLEELDKNKEGLFGGGLQQEKNRVQNESLKKQADLSVIQMGIQGRYDSAKAIADRAVQAQLERQRQRNEILQFVYQENKEQFTKAEQREFEAKQNERERAYNRQEQDIRDVYNLGLRAAENGASTSLQQQIFNAKSPQEAIQLASGYLTNPIDRAIKNAQLIKANQEIEQYNTTQDVLSGKFGSALRTASGLVGSERGKQSLIAMTDAVKNGDYTTAYALISNNVEESLTGENATKFGAARNDFNVMKGLRDAISEFQEGGGNLNLLTGTAEQIQNKLLGVTGDPELSKLATQLNRRFQAYRTQMTGAAFSPEESRDYTKVNPRTTASFTLNEAIISGALQDLELSINSTVNARVPGAQDIWNISNGYTTRDYLDEVFNLLNSTSGDELDQFLLELGL